MGKISEPKKTDYKKSYKNFQYCMTLRNCKLEWDTTIYLSEWLKSKTFAKPNTDKHMEQQKLW